LNNASECSRSKKTLRKEGAMWKGRGQGATEERGREFLRRTLRRKENIGGRGRFRG